MVKLRYLIFSLLIFTTLMAQGQFRQSAEESYKDANAYFYFEDYEEALALYLSVYNEFPNNANLDYRIGLCYLNIMGSKYKAIEHLERAAQNVSQRYSDNSIRETKAPVDAIFYLGNAYFSDNQLDNAQKTYERFRSQIKHERKYDMAYLIHQEEAIRRSKAIQKYPINFLRSNLGPSINNRFPNYNAVVSGDGKTLAYTTKERFYQAVMVARKEGKGWGKPVNITLDLVVEGNCSTLSLSYDGKELYLFKDDAHVGNIYVSNFAKGAWTPMRKLNENVNTDFYETHASVSADGKKLFFTSNRAGGYGELDLYVSERAIGGDWGPAKNLGPNINTRFNENTPFITSNDRLLFFSSDGHQGVGEYDIFFAQIQADGKWAAPINIGYPINTPDDDLFYQPIGDGALGLMSIFDPTGFGEKDITQVEIFLPKYQRSIVTSNDFFARKTDLPKRTLVIDTVAVSGAALIDPSKPEHKEYLDDEKHFTLFFEGKSYDLRDQSKEIKALSARLNLLTNKDSIEALGPVEENEVAVVTKENHLSDDQENVNIESGEEDVANLVHEVQIVHAIPNQAVTDTLLVVPITKYQATRLITSEERRVLENILKSLGGHDSDSLIMAIAKGSWDMNPLSIKLRTANLVSHSDSSGNTNKYTAIFAKLIDLVSVKSVEGKYRQSRKISQNSLDEDFFFRLQRLKRNTSPGLVDLFDEAIITQPNISSFYSLWKYLSSINDERYKPYANEFLSLLVESSLTSYYDLSEDNQKELLVSIESKSKPFRNIAIILVAALVFFFLFLYIRKRRIK